MCMTFWSSLFTSVVCNLISGLYFVNRKFVKNTGNFVKIIGNLDDFNCKYISCRLKLQWKYTYTCTLLTIICPLYSNSKLVNIITSKM